MKFLNALILVVLSIAALYYLTISAFLAYQTAEKGALEYFLMANAIVITLGITRGMSKRNG